MSEKFERLPVIPIDRVHAIEQDTRQFASITNGLPELVKNSKDAYARSHVIEKTERVILVLLQDGNTNTPSRIGVLDFAGASLEDFEGDGGNGGWITWSSRFANRAYLSKEIEGGYGNGGKSFMVEASTIESSMHSSMNGSRTKMGFVQSENLEQKYCPGYYLDQGVKIRNIRDTDSIHSLLEEVNHYEISLNTIKKIAPMFNNRKNWTLVELVGIKETSRVWNEDQINAITNNLQTHGQASLTIKSSSVYIFHNGVEITGPLESELLKPMDEFKTPFEFNVPEKLEDPYSKEIVDFIKTDIMKIYTSDKVLYINPMLKPRNVLTIRTGKNIVAVIPMNTIATTSVFGRLYGELITESLQPEDYYSGQLRTCLNDTKRARALTTWITEKLSEICKKIQDEMSDKRSYQERSRVEERLNEFREEMSKFLEAGNTTNGDGGIIIGPGGNKKRTRVKPGKVENVILEDDVGFIAVPIGVSIPIKHEAYDEKGKMVSKCIYSWECEPRDIITWDGGGNIVGIKPGKANLWVTETQHNVRSKPLEVNVHDIVKLTLSPALTKLRQGDRTSLSPVGIDSKGETPQRLALYYRVVPEGHGQVGRLGWFTAGKNPGQVTIVCQYGKSIEETCMIEITDEKRPPSPPTTYKGGIPFIVQCGDEAPGTTDLPSEQRTCPPNPEEPTIIMYDPVWEKKGIIWINCESAESRRVRNRASGSATTGRTTTRTFSDFLALKCYEILKYLKARQLIEIQRGKEANITIMEHLQGLAEAEMSVAEFIDTAFQIVDGWFTDE